MNREHDSPKTAREAALRALVRVEKDGAYLNLALPSLLSGLDPAERALAVQLSAGTIQRLNTLDWSLNLFSHRAIEKLTPWVRNLLRLSAYQLLYLDRIPDYAAVNEAVRLARRFGHRGVAGLTNALLRRLVKEKASLPWPDRDSRPADYLALKHSQPRWLVKRMLDRYGFEETKNWCRAGNKKPSPSIRPNLLKTSLSDLILKLREEGVRAEISPVAPNMLRMPGGASPASTRAFREGLFTVQGESSGLTVPLLSARPGETIIDLCSAPGGKTTHLAEMIGDQGQVIAVEPQQNRLQLVEKAARRLGLESVKPVLADGREIEKYGLPQPSAILVDAPCSGLGVIRRLPEIKWRRTEESLPALRQLQIDLLRGAARILPPGGRLLYSVCTTEPEETLQVAEAFTREHGNFAAQAVHSLLPVPLRDTLERGPYAFLWPHRHDLDGFFIALWRNG